LIVTIEINTLPQFENLKKGDHVACEFHRNLHDHPKKPYRFNVFKIYAIKPEAKEIILQKKNNIYFNYKMFLKGDSNLKSVVFIKHHE